MNSLSVLSGLVQSLQGAKDILSSFRKKHMNLSIAQFKNFYSSTGTYDIPLGPEDFPQYIQDEVGAFINAYPFLNKTQKEKIINDSLRLQNQRSYKKGECLHGISLAAYNNKTQQLNLLLITVSPFISTAWNEHLPALMCKSTRISFNISMNTSWLVFNAIKTYKNDITSNIEYRTDAVDPKCLANITDMIALAFSPGILGILQLPEEFLTLSQLVLKQQSERVTTLSKTFTNEEAIQRLEDVKDIKHVTIFDVFPEKKDPELPIKPEYPPMDTEHLPTEPTVEVTEGLDEEDLSDLQESLKDLEFYLTKGRKPRRNRMHRHRHH